MQKGEIVAFLDDDAIVPDNYVYSIIHAFETYTILLDLEEKYCQKLKIKTIVLQSIMIWAISPTSIINTEGNSAFEKKHIKKLAE
ncbi:MAG: hypothetical protein H6613_05865 [Ignavibacteriales bacterium]|nr:hypothetical protein [Ignavibacteriales bacterium]